MANYKVDYNDSRFSDVNKQKQDALNNANEVYNNMIESSDEYYQSQMDAAKDWTQQQQKLQQEQTDFAIEQIEQQKAKTEKDYIKEQKGAYVDWQKQSNQYGANAEQMASQGLSSTGYSESSRVSMYNTYQNRLGSAKEVYNQAVLNYDNSIKDARLQNSAKLAELAYQGLQAQLELALQGFQYKNGLITEQLQQQQSIEDSYYQRWQDVLSQLNTENALNEQARQYDLDMKYKQQQLAEQKRQANLDYQIKQQQLAEQKRQANLSSKSSTISDGSASTSIKLKTKYYSGNMTAIQAAAINKYGVFESSVDENGIPYQPKGIMYNGKDYGVVSKTGQTVGQYAGKSSSVYNSSGVNVSNQNLWKTKDGSLWIWNGSKMTYEPVDVTLKNNRL